MAIVIEVEEERWNDDEFSFFFLSNRAIIVMLPCEPRLTNETCTTLCTSNNRNSPLLSLQEQPMTKSETAFWEDWITLTHNGIWLRAYIQILDATWKVLFWFGVVLNLLRRWLMSCMKIMSIYLHIGLYNDIIMKTYINLHDLVLQTKNISDIEL